MKLLFDQNLSRRLPNLLRGVFPEAAHVTAFGLGNRSDSDVWAFAREHGYIIVSKDSDFYDRACLEQKPPKVIWIALGNCSTAEIERRLRLLVEQVEAFVADEQAFVLEIKG